MEQCCDCVGSTPLRSTSQAVWVCPKLYLTAVSELSRSEIKIDMICIAFFHIAFPNGWVVFRVMQPTPTSYPASHLDWACPATPWWPLPSCHNHFSRYSESCQHLEDLIGHRLLCRITNKGQVISYRTEESKASGNWDIVCFNKFKRISLLPYGPFIHSADIWGGCPVSWAQY